MTPAEMAPKASAAPSRGRAIAEIVLAATLFGTTGTSRALGPDGTDPVVAGAVRMLLSGPILWLVATRLARTRRLTDRLIAPSTRATLIGGVGVAVYQFAFFQGVARAGVGVGTILAIGSGPVFAGLLGRAFLGERPTPRWAASTAAALIGAALLVLAAPKVTTATARGGPATVDALGVALVLAAGLGYAGYTVTGRFEVLRGAHGPTVLGRSFTVAGVLLAPTIIGRPTAWLTTPGGLIVIAWLCLGPTVISYVLFADSLRTLTGSTVTTFMLVEPLTAVILGVVVLHERLALLQWLGAAVMAASLAVLALPSRPHSIRRYREV